MRAACDAVVSCVVVEDANRVGFVELGTWQHFLEKTQGHGTARGLLDSGLMVIMRRTPGKR